MPDLLIRALLNSIDSALNLGLYALNYLVVSNVFDVHGAWAAGAAAVLTLPSATYRTAQVADGYYEARRDA